jgi:hypothetical protein
MTIAADDPQLQQHCTEDNEDCSTENSKTERFGTRFKARHKYCCTEQIKTKCFATAVLVVDPSLA